MMTILYISIGIIKGFIIAYLILKRRTAPKSDYEKVQSMLNDSNVNLKILENSNKEILNQRDNISDKLEIKEIEFQKLNEEFIRNQSEIKYLNQTLLNQKSEIEDLNNRFKKEFENLANRILDEKAQKFTEQNKVNLDNLLKPLNEKIKDFEKKVEETYEKEARDRTSLGGEVKKLYELTNQISTDAKNLTNALKGQVKTQGNWGEMILERILEESGLKKDREYSIQKSFTSESGKRLQPDVIIKLPEERNIIIDSKVSLIAYERYISCESKEEQERALKEHIQSIKSHIDGLSSKNYQDIYNLNSLEYVFLFIPIEPAFLTAINTESSLWNYAYNKQILLISPTNLIAVLKITEQLWHQEYQNRNAKEIAEKGGALYDKFVGFVNDLIAIGNKLKETQKYYDQAYNKLSEGKGNIINRVVTLKELGLNTKKDLPQDLIDKSKNEKLI